MRPLIVLVLLALLGSGLGVTLALRHRAAPAARVIPAPRVVPASTAASGGGSGPGAPGEGAPERALRVIALGWDLAAPGLLANRGVTAGAGSEFAAAGIPAVVRVAASTQEIESALARGGADAEGADIAVLPLPALVASYERLRVLQPDVFFVTGWAGGREALTARAPDALAGSLANRDVVVTGTPGTPSAFLAAEVLALAGASPERVRWLAPGNGPAYTDFAAVEREPATRDAAGRPVLVTTADATRLVPYVAVASHAFASRHADSLRRWATLWIAGTRRLHDDPAAAAREIARIPTAPEALELVSRLGMIVPSGLADNARAMGLAGRGAVTLEALFRRAWRDWRAAGLLTTPEPDLVPLATDTVAALVRAAPARPGDEPAPPPRPGAPGRPPLLTWRLAGARLDDAALTEAAGWMAGAFERATLRVRVRDEADLPRVVEAARARFGLAEARVVPVRGGAPARNVAASVEVHVGL